MVAGRKQCFRLILNHKAVQLDWAEESWKHDTSVDTQLFGVEYAVFFYVVLHTLRLNTAPERYPKHL